MNRLNLIATVVAVAATLLAATADAQQTDGSRKAQPRMLADTGRFVPGTTAHLAVTFKIAPKWHLYSPTQNETGGPPTFEFTLPEGYELGEAQWPAPHRYVLDYGDLKILDHIYEHELTVIFPLHVPADAEPGSTARLSAQVSWVICSDTCIFESDRITLNVPVLAGEEDRAWSAIAEEDEAVFDRARQRHAEPLPKENPPVTVTVADDQVVFELVDAPDEDEGKDEGTFVAFYPAEDGLPLQDLAETGETRGKALKIPIGSARPGAASSDAEDAFTRVRGILEVRTNPDEPGRFWQIDEPSGTL